MTKMINRMLIAGLALGMLAAAGSAQEKGAAGQTGFIWKVRSKTATVYLLGTVHLAKPGIYPLAKTVEDCFAKADTLAVEANLTEVDKGRLQQLITATATYGADDTLEKHISDATYELVKGELEGNGLPIEEFNKIKPWFLALTLTTLELGKLGYDPNYGLDRYFTEKAQGKKRIVELESFDYQINLLNSFSDWEQDLFLLYTVRELATLKKEADAMLATWKAGDASGMEAIISRELVEHPELATIYEKLFYARNRAMAGKIERFLQSKGTTFVAVGAGHLVGPQGLVELLRGKGYSVGQL